MAKRNPNPNTISTNPNMIWVKHSVGVQKGFAAKLLYKSLCFYLVGQLGRELGPLSAWGLLNK